MSGQFESSDNEHAEQENVWTVLEEYDQENRAESKIKDLPLERREQIGEEAIKAAEVLGWQGETGEQYLNERLTKVKDIDDMANDPDSPVTKDKTEYNGKDIPVYHLNGAPFAGILHDIAYKSDPSDTGSETSRRLVEDPSFWTRSFDEASRDPLFRVAGRKGMQSDIISTSYINTECANAHSHFYGENSIIYGFDSVPADGIIKIYNSDGGTGVNSQEEIKGDNGSERIIDLEKLRSSYNEITIHRYDENGAPYLPKYIFVRGYGISDNVRKHAAFFGVPIVHLDDKNYIEREKAKNEQMFLSINEDSSYIDIMDTLSEICNTERGQFIYNTVPFGRKYGEDIVFDNDTPDYIKNAVTIEREKRLSFIKECLKEMTEKCNQATEKGELFSEDEMFQKYDIDSVQIMLRDADKQTVESTKGSERLIYQFNEIVFSFRHNGHETMTDIIDGEHPKNGAESPLRNADSSFFTDMEPVVRSYIEAVRNNRDKLSSQPSEVI